MGRYRPESRQSETLFASPTARYPGEGNDMKLKDIAGGLCVTLVTVVVLLGISEIALRAYLQWSLIYDVEMSRYATEIKEEAANPRIGHVHKPNAAATLMGVPVKINSDGLRDSEYSPERNGNYRIVFLGDSLTFGWGVAKSQTFEEILEAELSRTRPTEILNFGTGNYNTSQEVGLFIDKGLKSRPDHVVVFYFINDAEPTPRKSNWEFLGRLRIVTFFWSRLKSAVASFEHERSYLDYYKGLYGDGQPGWAAVKKSFQELRDICAARGITLQVVLLPELHVLDNYPFADQHRKLVAFLKENDIEALDLAPLFARERNPARLWVAPDDAHPNAIAHAMIAQYSLAFIKEGMNARKAAGED